MFTISRREWRKIKYCCNGLCRVRQKRWDISNLRRQRSGRYSECCSCNKKEISHLKIGYLGKKYGSIISNNVLIIQSLKCKHSHPRYSIQVFKIDSLQYCKTQQTIDSCIFNQFRAVLSLTKANRDDRCKPLLPWLSNASKSLKSSCIIYGEQPWWSCQAIKCKINVLSLPRKEGTHHNGSWTSSR